MEQQTILSKLTSTYIQDAHESAVAFKEWAVTVEALLKGKLIFVLRKGGIVEETRHFSLKSPIFYLMPAYEHQKEHLLKPEFQGRIRATMADWSPDQQHMKLQGYGQIVEDILITDEDKLHLIYEHHIWTEQFAMERLKWKKTQPLHLLVMRVYKLEEALLTTMQDSYRGCKSWVSIDDALPERKLIPVLSDEQFHEKYRDLKRALGEI